MSTIDERVVEMRFSNKDFEKNAKETLNTLNDLKRSLDDTNNVKSLQAVDKNLNSLVNSVNKLASVWGRKFLQMKEQALSTAESFAKSLTTDQIGAGFSKYEQKTRAIQTILAAVESQGKSLEDVTRVVEKLNKYTDETSYSFTEMISSIGKFTANGIDLEVAERAMEGIANEAARSGVGIQGANHAMYNFSQALATGAVQLMDWKSIETANMATQEFKQTIIETAKELGVLNKEGKTKKGTLVDYQTFNATLSEKWFTSEVLIKTLEKYSDTTTEFGMKAFLAAQQAITFRDAIDAVKDAVSTSWMKTFQIIFGNLEESIELWTDFCNAIIDTLGPLNDARNEMFQIWKDKGGRDDLIKGLSDIFHFLTTMGGVIEKAWSKVFPPFTADNLLAISSAIADLGSNLRRFSNMAMLYIHPEATGLEKLMKDYAVLGGEIEKGAAGEGIRVLQESLKSLGYYDGVIDGIFNDETIKALHRFKVEAGLVSETTGEMDEKFKNLKQGMRGKEVKEFQQTLVDLGYELPKYGVDGIFGPETQAAADKYAADLAKAAEEAEHLNEETYDAATNMALLAALGISPEVIASWKMLTATGRATSPVFDNICNIFEGVAAVFHIVWNSLIDVIKIILTFRHIIMPFGSLIFWALGALGRFFKEIDETGAAQAALKNLADTIDKITKPLTDNINAAIDSVISFFELKPKKKNFLDVFTPKNGTKTLSDFIDKISELITKSETWSRVSGTFTSIGTKFESFGKRASEAWNKFKKTLSDKFKDKVDDLGLSFEGITEKISSFVEFILEKTEPFVNNFNTFLDTFDIDAFLLDTWTRLETAVNAINDFFTNLYNDVSQNPEFVKTKDALIDFFSSIPGYIVDFVTQLPENLNSVYDFFTNLFNDIQNSEIYKSATENISKFFDQFGTDIQTYYNQFIEFINNLFAGSNSTGEEAVEGEVSKVQTTSEAFFHLVETIIGRCGEIFKSLDDLFGRMGVGGISALLGLIIGFKNIWGLKKTFDTFTSSFSDIVSMVKNKIQPAETKKLSDTMLKVAAAIGIIAVAMLIIGNMETDKFTRAVWVLGGISAVIITLGVLGALVNKTEKPKTNKFEELAKSLLNIALAIGIIAAAIFVLGNMEAWKLVQGFASVALIIGALIGITFLFSKFNQNGMGMTDTSGLLNVAKAVGILAVIAGILSLIPIKQFMYGCFNLLIIMGLIIGFAASMKALNNGNGLTLGLQGLMGVAGAIALLSIVAIMISIVPADMMDAGITNLMKVMVSLGIFMIAVTRLSKSSNFSYVGLIAVSVAVGILAGIAIMLAALTPEAMWQGVGGLAAIVGALSLLIFTLSKVSGNVNFLQLVGILTPIVAVIGIVALIMYALSDIDGSNMLKLAGAFAIFVGTVAIVCAALGKFTSPGNAAAGAAALTAAIGIIVAGVAAIVGGLGSLDNVTNGGVVEAITKGGIVLDAIGDVLNGLDDRTLAVLGTLLALSTVFGAFLGANSFGIIAGAVSVGTATDLIVLFVGALVAGLGAINELTQGGVVDLIESGGEVLRSVGEALGGLVGGIRDGFTGKSDLEKYTADIESYGNTLDQFASATSGITEENVKGAIAASEMIEEFYDKLPKIGGLVGWFQGDQDFSGFVTSLGVFGTGLRNFVTAVREIASYKGDLDKDIEKGLGVVAKISDFCQITQTDLDEMAVGNNNYRVNIVASEVYQIAETVKAVKEAFAGLNPSKLYPVILQTGILLNSVGELKKALSGDENYSITTENFLEGFNSEEVVSKITAFTESLGGLFSSSSETIKGYCDSFNQNGTELANAFASGLQTSSTVGAFSDIGSSGVDALESFVSRYEESGMHVVQGFANGILNNSSIATAAIAKLGAMVHERFNASLDINSPSRKFEESGMFSVLGLVRAYDKYGHLATDAVGSMADDMLVEAGGMMSTISNLLDDGFNADPVIRPVVDMSAIETGSRSIDNLIGGTKTIGLNAATSRKLASNSGSASGSRNNQNGSTTTNNSYSNDNSVTINGSFAVRDDLDVKSLAYEIAALLHTQKAATGVKTIG